MKFSFGDNMLALIVLIGGLAPLVAIIARNTSPEGASFFGVCSLLLLATRPGRLDTGGVI